MSTPADGELRARNHRDLVDLTRRIGKMERRWPTDAIKLLLTGFLAGFFACFVLLEWLR